MVAERELCARADGAVHARRRPRLHGAGRARAGARADRLRQRLEALEASTSASTASVTTRARSRSSASGAPSTGRTPSDSASRTRSTPRSSSTSSGTTSSRSRRTRARRSLEALYRRTSRSAPSSRRSSPPRPLHRAADGEAARRLHGRPPPRDRPRDRHDLVGLARLRYRPAALHAAERGRLGRRALARHGDLPRPLVGGQLRDAALLADRQAGGVSLPAQPAALVEAAIVSGAPPPSARPPARPSSPSRTGRWATRTRSGSSRATASSPRTRSAS